MLFTDFKKKKTVENHKITEKDCRFTKKNPQITRNFMGKRLFYSIFLAPNSCRKNKFFTGFFAVYFKICNKPSNYRKDSIFTRKT